jgi:hypothetical protein
MTYKLSSTRTKKTAAPGLTLEMASHYCKTGRDLIFLPESGEGHPGPSYPAPPGSARSGFFVPAGR